jgi:replication-associated recombination protein RarA
VTALHALQVLGEQLLTDIKAWIDEPSSKQPIYMLYGIAGIGKSTVAQTVAQYAASNWS